MKAFTLVVLTALIISQVSMLSSASELERRVARAMTMVNAYSFGSLTRCAAGGGNIAPFCGITYPVPEYVQIDAKAYDNAAQAIVNGIRNNPQYQASTACVQDMKSFYCNLLFPRCDPLRNEVIYNTSNCVNADEKCPQVVHDSLKKSRICDFIPRGTFYLNDCVKPPSFTYQTCPTAPSGVLIPKFLSANPVFQDISATSFKAYLKKEKVSDHCIQVAMHLECAATPFCSPNKTLLLTTITQRVCTNFYNCLPARTQAALKGKFNCNMFPNENTGAHVSLPINEVYLAGAYANRPNIMIVACVVLLTSIMRILTMS